MTRIASQYVRFAGEHPHLFQVMSDPMVDADERRRVAEPVIDVLKVLLTTWSAVHEVVLADVDQACEILWGTLYGIASRDAGERSTGEQLGPLTAPAPSSFKVGGCLLGRPLLSSACARADGPLRRRFREGEPSPSSVWARQVECEDGLNEARDSGGRAAELAQKPPGLEGGDGLFDQCPHLRVGSVDGLLTDGKAVPSAAVRETDRTARALVALVRPAVDAGLGRASIMPCSRAVRPHRAEAGPWSLSRAVDIPRWTEARQLSPALGVLFQVMVLNHRERR
jgi:hypothetical protein